MVDLLYRGATLLQWGHERALVEIASLPPTASAISPLQWGHERALVEIHPSVSGPFESQSFNGATSARSWK